MFDEVSGSTLSSADREEDRMAVGTLSREDRAVLARAALARAEQRTGARSVLPPEGREVPPEASDAPALVVLPHLPEVPAEQPTTGIITSERPPMAVPPPLAP